MNQEPNKETSQVDEPPERKFTKNDDYYALLGGGIRNIHQYFTSLDDKILLTGALQLVIESPQRNGELKYIDSLAAGEKGRYYATQSALVGKFMAGLGGAYLGLDDETRKSMHEDFQRFFAFYWMNKAGDADSYHGSKR